MKENVDTMREQLLQIVQEADELKIAALYTLLRHQNNEE